MKMGDRLREERLKRGWSQVYVAKQLGLKRSSTYANWEYSLRDPSKEVMAKLASLFEVTIDYLVTGNMPSQRLVQQYTTVQQDNKLIINTDGLNEADIEFLKEQVELLRRRANSFQQST
ncbi:helix-turn-helix transcriptional regulator [Bacillus taeanensis]|nr:helix-turn-helix transcriptional regulator [Bacillus taeanensis]